MTGFVLLAALLAMGAVLLIAVPLLRGAQAPAARWSALAAAALLLGGSTLLYALWGNWSWRSTLPADSPQTMVARLARKLERNPQDRAGWLLLGRSYTVLQEYPLAQRAFARAGRLSGGRDVEALTGEAEALALEDDSALDGRAAQLIEQALSIDPRSGKALFLGALVAGRRGDLPLARQRLASLLAQTPPPDVRALLERQIAALDARLAAGPAASAPGATPSGAGAPAQAGAAAAVRVRVQLAADLAGEGGHFPLFVFVRDPLRPGPPLAVKRLASEFPQEVELTGADAMVPGRVIIPGTNVQVVARIAHSGNAVGARGDPFGEITYRVGQNTTATLVIDRLTR